MNRNLILALGMLCLFVATVVILGTIMPAPHKPTDYLVIGGTATFLCLVVLFLLVTFGPGTGTKLETKADAKEDQTSRTSTDL